MWYELPSKRLINFNFVELITLSDPQHMYRFIDIDCRNSDLREKFDTIEERDKCYEEIKALLLRPRSSDELNEGFSLKDCQALQREFNYRIMKAQLGES